jgi:hypothetical protein
MKFGTNIVNVSVDRLTFCLQRFTCEHFSLCVNISFCKREIRPCLYAITSYHSKEFVDP